jgi:two-component system nitrate/nitrite response regulator NarL
VAAALAGYLKDGGGSAQKLTPRERQVLGLVVLGKTNQEIALNLKVSQSTVEKCMIRIYSKLDVTSRVEAAVRAVRDSLV